MNSVIVTIKHLLNGTRSLVSPGTISATTLMYFVYF